MLEVAIVSTKCALRDQFPEFMEYFNNREWEKNDDAVTEASDDSTTENTDTEAESINASDFNTNAEPVFESVADNSGASEENKNEAI